MKCILVLSAVLAVATSYPLVKMWTLKELDIAISKKTEDPVLEKYLINALNDIMLALFTGNETAVMVPLPSPSGSTDWTKEELVKAAMDPKTNPAYLPAMEDAYQRMEKNGTTTAQVILIAMDISTWTETDLKEAVKSPSTSAELRPYVEKALDELLKQKTDKAYTVTRVGLIPHKADYLLNVKAHKYYTKKTRPGL